MLRSAPKITCGYSLMRGEYLQINVTFTRSGSNIPTPRKFTSKIQFYLMAFFAFVQTFLLRKAGEKNESNSHVFFWISPVCVKL